MNEFRCSLPHYTSGLILGAYEGDAGLKVDQKNKSPISFVNARTKLLPKTIMTTNYWKKCKAWAYEDLMALKSRFSVIVEFNKPIESIRCKTARRFKVNEPCACCSRKVHKRLLKAYEAAKDVGHKAGQHLKSNPDYKNEVLIKGYNPKWRDQRDDSDSDAEEQLPWKKRKHG